MITNYTNWSVVISLAEGYFAITKYFKCFTFSLFHVRRIREETTLCSILSNSTSEAKPFFSKVSAKSCRAKKVVKVQNVV